MAMSLLKHACGTLANRLEYVLATIFNRYPPDLGLCLVGQPQVAPPPSSTFSLKDILGDGFLWAVPKHRRSLEKRHKRRFGHPDYVLKLLRPKTNIRACGVCGGDQLVGLLCPTCYKRVIDETKQMQDAIQEKLQLQPVEKEVVVLYQNEQEAKESYQGKQIVEMPKPRPKWFSKNLLQRTTQQPSTNTEVKPSDLG